VELKCVAGADELPPQAARATITAAIPILLMAAPFKDRSKVRPLECAPGAKIPVSDKSKYSGSSGARICIRLLDTAS